MDRGPRAATTGKPSGVTAAGQVVPRRTPGGTAAPLRSRGAAVQSLHAATEVAGGVRVALTGPDGHGGLPGAALTLRYTSREERAHGEGVVRRSDEPCRQPRQRPDAVDRPRRADVVPRPGRRWRSATARRMPTGG